MNTRRIRKIRRVFTHVTAELEAAHDQAVRGQSPRLTLTAALRHGRGLSRAIQAIERQIDKINHLAGNS